MKVNEALGMLFVVLTGVVLIAIGNWLRTNTERDLRTMKPARGVVVELKASQDSDGSDVYSPIIEFRPNSDADPIRFRQPQSTSRNLAPNIGTEVEVLYDPADPERARVNSFTDLWLLPLVLIGSGVLVILIDIGIFFWIVTRKRASAG
jgi:hypothetical protein